MRELVSIITPTYNSEKYIKETISSVKKSDIYKLGVNPYRRFFQ